MITDKEILTQALEQYATKTVSNLFGFSSVASQTLVRYGVRNMIDKYDDLINLFTSKDGCINVPLIIDAFKSEVKNRGGLKIFNIKLSETDFEEILNLYCELQKKNV